MDIKSHLTYVVSTHYLPPLHLVMSHKTYVMVLVNHTLCYKTCLSYFIYVIRHKTNVLGNHSHFTYVMSYETYFLGKCVSVNYSLSFHFMSHKSYVLCTGLIISFHPCYKLHVSNSYESLSMIPFHMSWVPNSYCHSYHQSICCSYSSDIFTPLMLLAI